MPEYRVKGSDQSSKSLSRIVRSYRQLYPNPSTNIDDDLFILIISRSSGDIRPTGPAELD